MKNLFLSFSLTSIVFFGCKARNFNSETKDVLSGDAAQKHLPSGTILFSDFPVYLISFENQNFVRRTCLDSNPSASKESCTGETISAERSKVLPLFKEQMRAVFTRDKLIQVANIEKSRLEEKIRSHEAEIARLQQEDQSDINIQNQIRNETYSKNSLLLQVRKYEKSISHHQSEVDLAQKSADKIIAIVEKPETTDFNQITPEWTRFEERIASHLLARAISQHSNAPIQMNVMLERWKKDALYIKLDTNRVLTNGFLANGKFVTNVGTKFNGPICKVAVFSESNSVPIGSYQALLVGNIVTAYKNVSNQNTPAEFKLDCGKGYIKNEAKEINGHVNQMMPSHVKNLIAPAMTLEVSRVPFFENQIPSSGIINSLIERFF